MGKGFLEEYLYVGNHVLPVENAHVFVKDKQGRIIYDLVSDRNGNCEIVPLDAPDVKNPNNIVPKCALYDVEVPNSNGYKKIIIHDVEIFDGQTTILPIQMHPAIEGLTGEENTEIIDIPTTRAVNECSSRSSQALRNTDLDEFTERILANEVAIPDYITVHLGSPNNSSAQNYTLPFKDYLKNVASREVFPTWTDAALRANILAQMSFALNRIYTLHYRSQLKDFDITNQTAWDQAFDPSKVTFKVMSDIVDDLFANFIRRQGRREPFHASYCNGTTSTCPGLYQCESQELGLAGYSAMQILKRYFPNDIQIVESSNFSSYLGRYPGTALKEGSSGEDVLRMQTFLNRLSGNWWITPIPAQSVNGFFGNDTKRAVMEFQERAAKLTPDGIIGKNTWYAITLFYAAAKELSELTSEGERISVGPAPPTVILYPNTDPITRGHYVVELQFLLNFIAQFYTTISKVIQNGVFRDDTKRSVLYFQKEFGLTQDGVVGPATWRMLYNVYYSIRGDVEIPTEPPTPVPPPSPSVPQFPGTTLTIGSSGSSVLLMQNYLYAISKVYSTIPAIVPDGSFGPKTEAAVIAFQRLFGLTADGKIGPITWYKIIDVYNGLTAGQTPQFPGTNLTIGSRGTDVSLMQGFLSAISKIFPSVPAPAVDGVFGTGTAASVRAFQALNGLTADGIIGKITWDKIVYVFNSMPVVVAPQFPGATLQAGSQGNNVIIMQKYLNTIAAQYPSIPSVKADGIFGAATQQAVTAFQNKFGLTADGRIGINTWNKIVSVYNLILMNTPATATFLASATPAVEMRKGSFDKYPVLLALSMFRR